MAEKEQWKCPDCEEVLVFNLRDGFSCSKKHGPFETMWGILDNGRWGKYLRRKKEALPKKVS